MGQYYDGTKLLSMSDINGNKPEIYIATSNRTAGKTTWFNRYAHKKFKQNHEKYKLIYRYNYELDDVCDKFFKDIQGLFFKDDNLTSKRISKRTNNSKSTKEGTKIRGKVSKIEIKSQQKGSIKPRAAVLKE